MFKKIGKFIKRGLKKVGKFFKRAFKKVGKFMGKLGPVGMLGMMLIMPQLGAWWADFGTWAKELTGPLKGLMKGIHAAGNSVGTAYSTVTEGISSLVKSIPGVGDAYQGFETWAQEQMDSARGFLGLETASPIVPTDTVPTDTDINMDRIKEEVGTITTGSSAGPEGSAYYSNIPINQNTGLSISNTPLMEEITVTGTMPKPVNLLDSTTTAVALKDITKEVTKIAKPDASKEWRSDDEKNYWKHKLKDIYGGYESTKGVLQEFGIGVEEPELSYPSYVADNYVPMYESAQVDWTQQGFAGTPPIGTGSPNYLQSIYASFQNDPYYQWMAQQRRA